MKAQLADTQRECNRLKHKLRDVETELHVAKEVTASATDRLTAHAERKDLLLSAGVERGGLERAKLEEELQRMERLLWERDQEIKKLRHSAGSLEKQQLQLDLEMCGLHAAKENSTLEARELSTGIADLLHNRLQKVPTTQEGLMESMASGSPFFGTQNLDPQRQREEKRLKDSTHKLELKRQEHAELKRRADQATADAKNTEEEDAALHHRVQLFERQLREKQGQMELHDKQFVHEGGLLREHVEELRTALAKEQTSFMTADHCVALHSQAQHEADATKREIESLLAIVLQLDSALRARHQHVHSAEVKSDAIDVPASKRADRGLSMHYSETDLMLLEWYAGWVTGSVQSANVSASERGFTVLYEGELTVLRRGGAESRYCVLRHETFQYYTSAKDFKEGKAPLVSFPILATSSFESSSAGLKLRHGARVIVLEGPEAAVTLWRKALEEAFGAARTRGATLQLHIFGLNEKLCTVLAEPAWRVRDLKAVIQSATGILPSEQRLVFRTDLLNDPDLLQGVFQTTKAEALELYLVRCPPAAECKPAGLRKTREAILQAVRHNWQQLSEADAIWRQDREIVLAAVRQDCMALQFASEDLREDPEIIVAALGQSGSALSFVGGRIKDHPDVLSMAVGY
ncbi:unnamed protein product [Symbiodinium natans]|uniref:Ubiquitin-like domain-containing protein n=1 Tax=Symbiodinium natans TaxID=878477 RepID=A0A812RMM7_9DINO|nr:unnamed protein product [Symbiodinium natans]